MFNALPDDLRDPEVSITNNIRTIDEDTFSPPISTFSALGVFHVMRYINVRYLLYLLTLLTTSGLTAGRSGLAVACLTAVREVPGSNRAVGSCVYRTTTAIYSLGHGLCAPFLQCLGQLSLLPSVGR